MFNGGKRSPLVGVGSGRRRKMVLIVTAELSLKVEEAYMIYLVFCLLFTFHRNYRDV